MNENKYEAKQIQLQDIISLMLSKLYIIVILALLGAVFMFVSTKYFTIDAYVSEGALVVSNITDDILESKKYFTSSDMDSSRSLSASCNELLMRRGFFEMVSKDIGGKYSANQLKRMVAISSVNETEVLSVAAIGVSKEDAYLVCSSVIKNAPLWIESIYDLGVVKIADEAYYPDSPISKNTASKTILGFFVGAVLGGIFIFVGNFFDDKIKRGADVTERYNIPVLGEFNQ